MKHLRKYLQLSAIISYLLLVVNYGNAQNSSVLFFGKTINVSPIKGKNSSYVDHKGCVHDTIFYNQKLPNFITKQLVEKEYKVYDPNFDKDSLNMPTLLLMEAIKYRLNVSNDTDGRAQWRGTRTINRLEFNEKWILDTLHFGIERQSSSLTIREQTIDTLEENGVLKIIGRENRMATIYYKNYSKNHLKKIYKRAHYTGYYLTEVPFRDTTSFFYNAENRLIFFKTILNGIKKDKYKVKLLSSNEVLDFNSFIKYMTNGDPKSLNKALSKIEDLLFIDRCYVDPKTLYVHKEIHSIILYYEGIKIEINPYKKLEDKDSIFIS